MAKGKLTRDDCIAAVLLQSGDRGALENTVGRIFDMLHDRSEMYRRQVGALNATVNRERGKQEQMEKKMAALQAIVEDDADVISSMQDSIEAFNRMLDELRIARDIMRQTGMRLTWEQVNNLLKGEQING